MKSINKFIFSFLIILGMGWGSGLYSMDEPTQSQESVIRYDIRLAAFIGDKRAIKSFLAQGVDVDASDEEGLTPLHNAARNGQVDVIKLLLKRGATIDAPDNNGWTPLHMAADDGQVAAMKLLLKRGATFNSRDRNGLTALHAAARNGHAGAIKLLLKKGVTIDTRDNNGTTPLHFAADNDQIAAMKLLLKKGATIDAPDNHGETPLHAAADNGHVNAIRLLLKRGASINARDNNGTTPLHFAASQGHIGAIKLLLKKGASINAGDNHGATPLSLASRHGRIGAMRLLLHRGAHVNIQGGSHVLHDAAFGGHIGAIRFLLEQGVDVNVSDPEGGTPLHYAVAYGQGAIRFLLEQGADIRLLTGQQIQSLPLLQQVLNALSLPIDEIESDILPIVLTQLAINRIGYSLQGEAEKVIDILTGQRSQEITSEARQNLMFVLVRQYVALLTSPNAGRHEKLLLARLALIQQLLPYASPWQALVFLVRQINRTPPGDLQTQLKKLFKLLMHPGQISFTQRMLLNIAQRPISMRELEVLTPPLIESLLRISTPDLKTQLHLLNEAIATNNAGVFVPLLHMFRAYLAQQNLEENQYLQDLLKAAAMHELTAENTRAMQVIVSELLRAGANPTTIVVGEFEIPLITWLELEDEVPHAIINLLRGTSIQPTEADRDEEAEEGPSEPRPVRIAPVTHTS